MTETTKKQLKTLIAVLVVTELILHFCFDVVDSYFFNFAKAAITAEIAVIAVIVLLLVLVFREEVLVGLLGNKKLGGRNMRHKHYRGLAAKGQFGFVEAMLFIAYVVASLVCFGFISLPDTTYKTLVLLVVVISSLILLSQKAHIKFTALEMLCFAISVILPLLATGLVPQLTFPATWTDSWHLLGLWAISAVAVVVMAYQD